MPSKLYSAPTHPVRPVAFADVDDHEQLVQYRRLVSSVRDYAILMLGPGGEIRTWNAGAQRLKGYTPEEAIGQHFSIFYTEPDRARDHPAYELAIAADEGRYEEEGWRVRKNGTTFWASVTITAIRDDSGNLTGFAKVTRDLTERRRADAALREAVEELRLANEELDRFAAVAAHDMTDPLRTISGFAELLEAGGLSADEQRDFSGYIKSSAVRLTEMIHGLLAYARAGKSHERPEPVDLVAAGRQVVADLGGLLEERRAIVDLALQPGTIVMATPSDVSVILQNLISNAVKFGDEAGPHVSVAADAVANNGLVRTTVSDNGAGIEPEFQRRIFGAFERAPSAERAGYGLGLAICQRLVVRHGGAIGVESGPGKGSRFWFTLPGPGVRPRAPSRA